jgi:hypothetical protein
MPRAMSSAMLVAIAEGLVSPAFFVEASFATGPGTFAPVYIWSGFGSIVWNGQTWLGAGALGSISMIEDGSTVEPRGIQLGFSGFDSTLLPSVLSEFALGQPVTVYLGLFSGGSLIASPVIAWAGQVDQPNIDANSQTAKISINCERRLIDLNVPVGRRYTTEDQQRDWPGDLGFIFGPQCAQITLYWGSAPTSTGTV